MDYCRRITVDDLSCNTVIVLQYNSYLQHTFPTTLCCNTNPCLAIQLPSQQASYCNTIFHHAIQFFQPSLATHCNTNFVLQYNYLANKPPIAIQFSTMQYNFFQPNLATYCNTNFVLQYNFFPSHTALSCNTLSFLAIQFLA